MDREKVIKCLRDLLAEPGEFRQSHIPFVKMATDALEEVGRLKERIAELEAQLDEVRNG